MVYIIQYLHWYIVTLIKYVNKVRILDRLIDYSFDKIENIFKKDYELENKLKKLNSEHTEVLTEKIEY